MSTRSRASTAGLLARHLSTHTVGPVLVALLLALSIGGVAALPHTLSTVADDELRYELDSLPPSRVDVNGSATLGTQNTEAASADGIFRSTDAALRAVPSSVPAPLGALMGEARWIAKVRAAPLFPDEEVPGISPEVRLAIDLGGADRVQYVDGRAPAAWRGSVDEPHSTTEPLDIAVSMQSASSLGLAVGDAIGSPYGLLRVSGIFEPVDGTDGYWDHASDLLNPLVIKRPGSPDTVIIAAYVDPESARGLGTDLSEAEVVVWYPTLQPTLQYAETGQLLQQIQGLTTVGASLPNGQRVAFQTGLADALGGVILHVSALNALLAMAGSAPLGVVLAALVLGIRSVLLKRQPAVALTLARGASGLDVRMLMAVEGAVIAIPAALVGGGAAILLTGGIAPAALVAPILVTAAVPVTFALAVRTDLGGHQRFDLQSRARSGVRWIVEVAIAGFAGVSYLLLSGRGLASSTAVGIDPLLVGTPLLLSLAVCVVVLRLYPLPLLALQRVMRGRRGAAGLLGSARAIREPAIGLVAVVAMLAGVSTAVFSLVLGATVTAGLDAGARAEVGADARVDSLAIAESTREAIRTAPGVTGVAPIQYIRASDLRSDSRVSVTLILADTVALHEVRPDLPVLTSGSEVRVLASSDLAGRIAETMTIDGRDAVLEGFAPSNALPGVTSTWVLIDSTFAEQVLGETFRPTSALISLGESASGASGPAALAAVIPADSTLVERSVVLAESAARPSVSGLRTALVGATTISALMAVITVVLAAVASAPARTRVIRVAHILGMSPRQVRRVIAWEIAPVAIASVVAGVALGIALPYLVLGVVDLRTLIGGSSAVVVTIPWSLIVAGAAGFSVVVALAGTISIVVARRVDLARQAGKGAE